MFAVSSHQALLATLFLDLAIIAGFALALGTLARRVGQAVVVGEITAGLLLGPSVLGLLPGGLDTLLFPPTALPVLARVLTDAKLSDSPLGTLALTVAAMTDLVAWVSLAALTATLGRTDGLPFGAMALGLVGFLVVLVFAV